MSLLDALNISAITGELRELASRWWGRLILASLGVTILGVVLWDWKWYVPIIMAVLTQVAAYISLLVKDREQRT